MLQWMLAAVLLVAGAPQKGGARPAPAAQKTAPARARSMVVLLDTPSLAAPLQAELLAGLKAEVVRSAAYTWQEPPPVTVDELVLALSCKKLDVDCVMRMGEVVRADSVLVATLGGQKGRDLTLLLVQFKPDRAQQKTGASLRNDKTLVADASAAVRAVLGPVRPSVLEVVSNPPGALVSLDAETLGPAPVSHAGVTDGHHEVGLRLDGHLTASRGIDVTSGDLVHLEVTLEKEPQKAAPPVATAGPANAASPAPSKASPAAETPGGPPAWVGPARLGLLGVGGLGLGAGVLTAVAGVALLGLSGLLYGLIWTVQAAIRVGRPLVYPTSLGGFGVGGLGLLVFIPLGAALVAAGVAVGVIFR